METPVCRQCGKKLRPFKRNVDHRIETVNVLGDKGHSTITESVIVPGQFVHDNLFCTYRCGYDYGVNCAREKDRAAATASSRPR